MVEDELGQRVGDGLGISADDIRDLPPLSTQQLAARSESCLQRVVLHRDQVECHVIEPVSPVAIVDLPR
jgi:hypothetical protein